MIEDSNAEHMMSLNRDEGIHRTQGGESPRRFHKLFVERFIRNTVYNKKLSGWVWIRVWKKWK